ncbi:MAG: FtsB family cell division protein [Pseudomonadales bacterium]|jgi:cell division protein FtsB
MTKRRSIIAVLLLLLAGLQYRLWVGESSFAHVDGLTQQSERLQVSNETKQRRNDVLKAEIVELKNGLDAVEEKARTEWGLVKPDETFYLLVDKDQP